MYKYYDHANYGIYKKLKQDMRGGRPIDAA